MGGEGKNIHVKFKIMADFSKAQIQEVWERATTVAGNDPNVFRKDRCTAWIARSEYGNRNSKWGWEIDHIIPETKGGSSHVSNLQPLHWENNAAKADGPLVCVIVSNNIANVRR